MLIRLTLQSYFCVIKHIAMLQQNFILNQLPAKAFQPLLIAQNNSLSKAKDIKEKMCKQRNENGWCSKSQRQCLLADLFSKH